MSSISQNDVPSMQAIILFEGVGRMPGFYELKERASSIHAGFADMLEDMPPLRTPEDQNVELRHFQCAYDIISIVHHHSKIPESVLAEALSMPRIGEENVGREVQTTIQRHTSYAFLTIQGNENIDTSPLQSALSLTLAAATLATIDGSLAVYWPASKAVLYTYSLLEIARRIDDGILPLELWVNLVPEEYAPGDNGEEPVLRGLYTNGLLPITGVEIEFAPSTMDRQQLAVHTLAVASAILQDGADTLVDGDILGQENQQLVRLRLKNEGTRPDIPVIELSQEHI